MRKHKKREKKNKESAESTRRKRQKTTTRIFKIRRTGRGDETQKTLVRRWKGGGGWGRGLDLGEKEANNGVRDKASKSERGRIADGPWVLLERREKGLGERMSFLNG